MAEFAYALENHKARSAMYIEATNLKAVFINMLKINIQKYKLTFCKLYKKNSNKKTIMQ